jgi:hypothetical protein
MGDLEERLNHIFQAQRCGGPEVGMSEVTSFLLAYLALDKADLDAICPHLVARDPGLPDLGDVGRYRGVAVFPRDSVPKNRSLPRGLYQGVGFGYFPMDHVFM